MNTKRKILSVLAASLVIGVSALSNQYIKDAQAASSVSPRFVEIDSSGLDGGAIYVDTKTDIEYVIITKKFYHGISSTMTPLYDKDGKPLVWQPED